MGYPLLYYLSQRKGEIAVAAKLTKERFDLRRNNIYKAIEMYGATEELDGMGYLLQDMLDLFDHIDALEAAHRDELVAAEQSILARIIALYQYMNNQNPDEQDSDPDVFVSALLRLSRAKNSEEKMEDNNKEVVNTGYAKGHYTHAELILNQAATVREAAEKQCPWCARHIPFRPDSKVHMDPAGWECCRAIAILALPSDQLALDRHDAEMRKRISNVGSERDPCGHFKANLVGDDYGHFTCDACKRDAEFRAQTAAMLEKAAALMDTHIDYPGDREEEISNSIFAYARNEIRALIPTDAAAALADKVQQAVREAQLKEHYEWPSPPLGSENWTDWAMHLLKLSKNDSERIAQLQAAAGAPEGKK